MCSLRSAGLFTLLLVLLSSVSMGYCYKVVDVTCGEYHSLLLMENGSLWSCGSVSQLNLGTDDVTANSPFPVRVEGENGTGYLTGIVSVDAGWYHSLACDELGRVWAWGTDTNGQLGNGTAGNSVFPQRVRSVDGSGYLTDIVYVSAGRSGTHSLAVTGDGFVYGWGNNGSGQCGIGQAGGSLQLPKQVRKTGGALLTGIKEVNAGVSHSLALDNNGGVWEFGSTRGSLATLVSGLPEIVQLATCGHSLALDVNGNVWCWTSGTPTKVTDGEMNTVSGYLENIKEISASLNFSVAVDNNGFVWSWFHAGAPAKVTAGQMAASSGYLENIDKIDAGYFNFQLAVDAGGNVWSWGSNSYGELGVGDTESKAEPTRVECVQSNLVLTIEPSISSGCLTPQDSLSYTVCLTNDEDMDFEDVEIILHLDQGLNYPEGAYYIDASMEPVQPDPRYDDDNHTITIRMGNGSGLLEAGEQYCEEFYFEVNSYAQPGMSLLTRAELAVGERTSSVLAENSVCCWGDYNTIFVDQYATGADTGLNWADAYSGTEGLSKALYRATHSSCAGPYTIYIASGNYFPGTQEDDSFVLPEGTEIYGGFPTGGCDFTARNPKVYEALLTGQVDDDLLSEIDNVVTMGHNTLLDGVAIARAKECGIFGNTVNFSIKNCTIADNERYGVYALNGNVTIERCKIKENDWDGIYHSGTGFTLDVMNSWVMRNGRYGIYTYESNLLAKNSIVSESDMKEEGSDGIFIVNPTNPPILYNNTIANNKSAGIFFSDNGTIEDPNDYPDIKNCIIYYNNAGGNQLNGLNANNVASYSCIQNCSPVNNNINASPLFAYPASAVGEPDPNNYRLSAVSPLKDMGCPTLDYSGQTDYDNEERVSGLGVEIGADELHFCSGVETKADISNDLDINKDGIVNMLEYQYIAKAWLSHDPNDPLWLADPNMLNMEYVHPVLGPACYALAWNPVCNFDNTGDSQYNIDIADLIAFLEDSWLWQACWYEPYNSSSTTMMATMAISSEPESEPMLFSRFSSGSITTLARTTSKILFVEEPVIEEEVNPYAQMTNSELALFVKDIQELKALVNEQAQSDSEDSEDLTDLMLFFDEILADIQETLQK